MPCFTDMPSDIENEANKVGALLCQVMDIITANKKVCKETWASAEAGVQHRDLSLFLSENKSLLSGEMERRAWESKKRAALDKLTKEEQKVLGVAHLNYDKELDEDYAPSDREVANTRLRRVSLLLLQVMQLHKKGLKITRSNWKNLVGLSLEDLQSWVEEHRRQDAERLKLEKQERYKDAQSKLIRKRALSKLTKEERAALKFRR